MNDKQLLNYFGKLNQSQISIYSREFIGLILSNKALNNREGKHEPFIHGQPN